MKNLITFKILLYIFMALAGSAVVKFYHNPNYQNALVYYLSASTAPLSLSSIKFSSSEISHYQFLDNEDSGLISMRKYQYKFHESGKEASSIEIANGFGYVVSIGFLAYVKLTKFIFNSFGDVQGIVIANMSIHILASIVVIQTIKTRLHSLLFALLYTFNPFVIYIVTFPYYYYIAVIPGAIAIYLYERKDATSSIGMLIIISMLLFSVMLRSTLLFGILLIFIRSIYFGKNKLILIYTIIFLGLLFYFFINNKLIYGPWHSVYVGIGAYSNDYGIYLSDSSSMEYLLRNLNISILEFQALSVQIRQEIWKAGVLEIFSLNPLIFVWNAFKNILQLYGFGYSTKYQLLQYFSMAMGFAFFVLSIRRKLFFHIKVIMLLNLGYVIYFPPLPMYMAGSYIIIMHGWLKIIEEEFKHARFALK